jgi:tRNA-2-methylthio-N6-dimethylallyladenosine synthase
LIAVVRKGSRSRNMALLGERREVLVEKEARRGGLLQARTRDFKTVIMPGGPEMIGQYVEVELTGTTGSTFTGGVIPSREPLPMR